MQEFGRPRILLGLLPDPELHDSRSMLRAGDSLITFTDSVDRYPRLPRSR